MSDRRFMDILQTIANAKPGSMIDVRSPDNQVDSFPVEEVQALSGNLSDEILEAREASEYQYQPHHELI